MSEAPLPALERLLTLSLAVWGTRGSVESDGTSLSVTRDGHPALTIAPAPPALPFRWMVTIGERTRPATSVHGVLRHVRAELDPAYQPSRIRLAPLPIVMP